MNSAKYPEFDNHQFLLDLSENKQSGLQGFIAIHNLNLGPALGGTRIFDYPAKEMALRDVLRLSRVMTYKCAIAGLPFGGGKGVVIAKAGKINKKMLREYALAVSTLRGMFYTGEDAGLTEIDVQHMLKFSPYFIGKTGLAGDPSTYAALSTFLTMQVALREVFGSSEVAKRSFAIQGVGKTGGYLARILAEKGAKVFVGDIDGSKVKKLTKAFKNIRAVSVKDIAVFATDVYCPCSLGDEVNRKNVKKIKANIIVGASNNQLESPEIAEELFRAGILHVPDYIANAGGLLDVADELLPGGYNKNRVLLGINSLKDRLGEILKLSKEKKQNPDRIADEIAERIFRKKSPVSKMKNLLAEMATVD